MGYYTSYGITFHGKVDKVEKVENELSSASDDARDIVELGSIYSKWYYHEQEIGKVAKANPDVLIVLFGNGEETGDVWEKRWKGSHFECQEMAIPPFEDTELLTPGEKEQLKNKQ